MYRWPALLHFGRQDELAGHVVGPPWIPSKWPMKIGLRVLRLWLVGRARGGHLCGRVQYTPPGLNFGGT
jgi:hypothetical protein